MRTLEDIQKDYQLFVAQLGQAVYQVETELPALIQDLHKKIQAIKQEHAALPKDQETKSADASLS